MHNDNSQINNFFKFIAYLQILGIILVVFGHSIHEYPDGNHGLSMPAYQLLYTFRMPLFMFTSGFLMVFTAFLRAGAKSERPYRFVLKKVKRLLIPFITLSLVTFLPRALFSNMADDNFDATWETFFKMFVDKKLMVIPYFWFIQSSFTLITFNYLMLYLSRRMHLSEKYTQLFLVITFSIIPFLSIEWTGFFSFNDTVRLCIYFALGGLYAFYMKKINRIIPWGTYSFLLATFIAWLTLYYIANNRIVATLCSMFGIMMCISIAKIMEERRWHILDHLIGANYIIFLLSWYFNVLTQQVLAHYVILPWWVHTILSLSFGIYMPWLAYRYFMAHPESKFIKASAFLLGQNIRKPIYSASSKIDGRISRFSHTSV